MNQKSFIQIPILIAIIVSLIVVAGVGTGIVLHKQGKLTSLIANVSQIFKGAEKTPIIKEKEIKPEEPQIEQEPEVISQEELEQTKLEAERLRKEAVEKQKEIAEQQESERQRQLEEQRKKEIQQSEIYKNAILSGISLVKGSYQDQIEYIDKLISFLDSLISDLEKLVEKNNDFSQRITFKDLKELIYYANKIHLSDIKILNIDRDMLNKMKEPSKEKVDAFTKLDALVKSYNIISKSDFKETGKTLEQEFQLSKLMWEVLDSLSKQIFEDANKSKESLAEIMAMAESLYPQTTYEFSPRYETYYYSSPLDSTYKFLQDYYQREQLRALQNIGDQLHYIWRELAY